MATCEVCKKEVYVKLSGLLLEHDGTDGKPCLGRNSAPQKEAPIEDRPGRKKYRFMPGLRHWWENAGYR